MCLIFNTWMNSNVVLCPSNQKNTKKMRKSVFHRETTQCWSWLFNRETLSSSDGSKWLSHLTHI